MRRPAVPIMLFISKHWRGEYSLPRTYWLHGVLFGFLLLAVGGVLVEGTGFELPVRGCDESGFRSFCVALDCSRSAPDPLRPAHTLDQSCGFYVHAVFY